MALVPLSQVETALKPDSPLGQFNEQNSTNSINDLLYFQLF